MRNYYEVLGIDRLISSSIVEQSVEELTPEELADEDDLEAIMSNDKWRGHYRRVHLQYDAIAAVMENPSVTKSAPVNTHQWDKRAIEFAPEQKTIELS